MSVSSTSIAIDIFEEFGKLRTRLGKLVVSAGTFDDFVEVILITIVLATLENFTRNSSILQAIIGLIFFALLITGFKIFLIPYFLHSIENRSNHAQLFTGVLIMTIAIAIVARNAGIGIHIGALLSGILIRQGILNEPHHKPWERTELTQAIHTLAFGFLVPFFFFNVGFQTNIFSIWNNMPLSITITILAIAGTWLGTALGYYLANGDWKSASIIGWAMNAKGDTELVVAHIALSVGVISIPIFSSLIFMAVVSTIISPLVLKSRMTT